MFRICILFLQKYLEPLKSPENANLLDATLVDEIFYQIPFLLSHHQGFLDELRKRLEHWDIKQKIGDVFLEMFSKPPVIENYTNYVNNWKKAREILKSAQQSKPGFSRFLEVVFSAYLKRVKANNSFYRFLGNGSRPQRKIGIRLAVNKTDTKVSQVRAAITAPHKAHRRQSPRPQSPFVGTKAGARAIIENQLHRKGNTRTGAIKGN